MPDFSFVAVAVIAFLAPVIRELIPKLFVPAIVLELVLGIVVGPQVLDIAHSSQPVELFSTIGLAALLFLAGREIDIDRLRGRSSSVAWPASRWGSWSPRRSPHPCTRSD